MRIRNKHKVGYPVRSIQIVGYPVKTGVSCPIPLTAVIVILPQTVGTVNLYAQAVPYWFVLSIACADEDDVTSISSYVFPGPNVS